MALFALWYGALEGFGALDGVFGALDGAFGAFGALNGAFRAFGALDGAFGAFGVPRKGFGSTHNPFQKNGLIGRIEVLCARATLTGRQHGQFYHEGGK